MNINDYQRCTNDTAIYPGQGTMEGMFYLAMKLAGEAGEVAEKIAKLMRDEGVRADTPTAELSSSAIQGLVKELGDVEWYVAQVAEQIGVTMSLVLNENLLKLADRKARGTLQGSGDDR